MNFSSSSVAALSLFCLFAGSVQAHGFLWAVESDTPNVRGLQKMNYNIDSLRNPLLSPNYCRGEPATSTKSVLTLGTTMTLTLAISAAHIGPCHVEINGIQISPNEECVANTVNGCRPVPGAFAGSGLCLHEWTFPVQNADKLTCTNDCVLRWMWSAEHISATNPERYENCIDVTVVKGESNHAVTEDPKPIMTISKLNNPIVIDEPVVEKVVPVKSKASKTRHHTHTRTRTHTRHHSEQTTNA